MPPRRNTTEDILQASLRLFARAGFEATGMREIAAAVGIQPASVYKHFAGKQAILDAIVERMGERYNLTAAAIGMPEGGMDEQARGYAATPVAQMADLGEAMFRYWTEDEFATLFRQMLKQYKDTGVDIYFDLVVENSDPSSSAGKQTTLLMDCNLDSVLLTKLDADSDDPLEEDADFTFEDYDILEEFTKIQ